MPTKTEVAIFLVSLVALTVTYLLFGLDATIALAAGMVFGHIEADIVHDRSPEAR